MVDKMKADKELQSLNSNKKIIKTLRLSIESRNIDEMIELMNNEPVEELKIAYQEMIDLMKKENDPFNYLFSCDWDILYNNSSIGGIGFKGLNNGYL